MIECDSKGFQKYVDLTCYTASPFYVGFFQKSKTISYYAGIEAAMIYFIRNWFCFPMDLYAECILLNRKEISELRVDSPEIWDKYRGFWKSFQKREEVISHKEYEKRFENQDDGTPSFDYIPETLFFRNGIPLETFVNMSVGFFLFSTIQSHCFFVNPNERLIYYPHNDCGYGLIAMDRESQQTGVRQLQKMRNETSRSQWHIIIPAIGESVTGDMEII